MTTHDLGGHVPDAITIEPQFLTILRERYTPTPVPPCRVCGGELTVQSAGGFEATKYGCPIPPGVTYKDWSEHYSNSIWRAPKNAGDSLVLALVDAYEAGQQATSNLLDLALGRVVHTYMGLCPDGLEGWDSRDPECPACQALTRYDHQEAR